MKRKFIYLTSSCNGMNIGVMRRLPSAVRVSICLWIAFVGTVAACGWGAATIVAGIETDFISMFAEESM